MVEGGALHIAYPVSLYVRVGEELEVKSLCVMSDDLQHDTCFVHEVMRIIATYCEEHYPQVKDIQYFSDGCGAQYKNFKNFVNVCLHAHELSMTATWNFFATSHGKGPCDGIGGTVKRLARMESYRRVNGNYLNTFDKLYAFCEDTIHNVSFYKLTSQYMEERRPAINARWQGASTVAGTHSYHQFLPIDHETISYKQLSCDPNICGRQRFSVPLPPMQFDVGTYVAAVYDRDWYIGFLEKKDTEAMEYSISFMHPKMTSTSLHWPSRPDTCLCPVDRVLCCVSPPLFTSSAARSYKLEKKDYDNIIDKYAAYLHSIS